MGAKGEDMVGAAVADGERSLARRRAIADPPPLAERDDGKGGRTAPGQWLRTAKPGELPPLCPVIPMGRDGDTYWFQDAAGQIRGIRDREFGQNTIQSLFSPHANFLEHHWPRFAKVKEGEPQRIDAFRAEKVRATLFAACDQAGLWSPEDKVRGRGGWLDRAERLVWHTGEEIYVAGEAGSGGQLKPRPPGLHDRHLYPRRPALPAPWPRPVKTDTNPAVTLMRSLARWSWDRPEVDPALVLGWFGVALAGAALGWRPAVWVIGDKGVGKSRLQTLVATAVGDPLIAANDTTAAGIYQRLGFDCLPVALDELEAEDDNRRPLAVVRLARLAASGGQMMRGGADHHGAAFTLRSAFFFSSINQPPVPPQDLSRMAVLTLHELSAERIAGPEPVLNPDTCPRMLLRRLLDEWHRWPATFAAYREVLAAAGHNARGQDTYGTLLAMADLLLGDEGLDELELPSADAIGRWGDRLAPSSLPEVADARPNWKACLDHLWQVRVDVWRGGSKTSIGGLISAWMKDPTDTTRAVVDDLLSKVGLALADRSELGKVVLAVPNTHTALAQLFHGSVWGGGASGSWASALRRAPADIACADPGKNRVRINGKQERCTLIVLDKYLAD